LKGESALWFLAALLVKGAYLLAFGGAPELNGDAVVYIQSIENLVSHGTYAWDISRPETYAARMPGMLFPYGLFRLFLSPVQSQALLQCFQATLDAFGVVVMLSFARALNLGDRAARAVAFLYLVSTLVSSWNGLLATESLATSGSFLGIWLCCSAAPRRLWLRLFLGSGILAWVAFLKAFYFIWIVAIATSIAWIELRRSRTTRSTIIAMCAVMIAPFLLLSSLWTARNLRETGRFVPLQDGLNGGYAYSPEYVALRAYMKTVGGDFVSWNPKAEVRWFDPWAGQTRPPGASYPPDTFDFSLRAATESCDRDKLRAIRANYRLAQAAPDARARELAGTTAARGLDECREAFIRERPWDNRVLAPIRILVAYLGHSGTYNLFPRPFSELTIIQKLFKLAQSSLHVGTVLFGIPGALWLLYQGLRTGDRGLPIGVAALGQVLGFPLVLRAAEYRYLVMAYPLLFLCGAAIVVTLIARVRSGWRPETRSGDE
jgi:hypothetical protein